MKKYCNDKLENFLDATKINELINRKQPEPVKKKSHTVMWVFIIIGIVAAVAGIGYALYRYFTPDYADDYEDDFDDDFDDEFYEDDEKEDDSDCNECQADDNEDGDQ